MGDSPRPFARQGLLRRGIPFLGAMALGFLALPLLPGAESDLAPIAAAALLNAAVVGVVVLVPWRRLPSWAQVAPPLAYLVVVALLREDGSGAKSGYEVLAFLPVIWLALYGSLAQLVVAFVGVTAYFLAPSALVEQSTLPSDELTQAMFSVAIAVIILVLAQQLFQASRQRAAEADRHLEAMREADHLKDEFLSLISHELRTPLAAIIGSLELLSDNGHGGLSDEERDRFHQSIGRNSERLLSLVGDLQFVSDAQAGKFSIRPQPLDLSALVALRAEKAMLSANEKGVDLALDVGPVATCHGDPDRLAQLVDNLVSNAVNYTPKGERVEVRLSAEGERGLLEVTNTGVCIPPEELARVFERFSRASTATRRHMPGVGLGLAIAKAIAEAHGGGIDVRSTEGVGTTFSVELPLERRSVAVPARRRRGEPVSAQHVARRSRQRASSGGSAGVR